MGTNVSSELDNDDLVDNLIESGYIKTERIERIFRIVDRANYVLTTHRERAYKDFAWKHGNIHLSAPCVYSEVMEGLSLEPGHSFLNIGSGTGYINTLAGLILTRRGTNHGIELYDDCIRYAHDRLEEFKLTALAVDMYDFCEPLFVQGNCLNIVPGRQYDRVYCGAACPENYEAFIKQFVRVGGVLVMPFKEHLLRLYRINKHSWVQRTLLPVFVTTLIMPTPHEQTLIHLPDSDPPSLQEICRGEIRHRLRQNVWSEHPEFRTVKPIVSKRDNTNRPYTLGRVVIPVIHEFDVVESDDDYAEDTQAYLAAREREEAKRHQRLVEAFEQRSKIVDDNEEDDKEDNEEDWDDEDDDEYDLDFENQFKRIPGCGMPTPPSEEESEFETVSSPNIIDQLFPPNETNSREMEETQNQTEKQNEINFEESSNQRNKNNNTVESSPSNSEEVQMSDNSDEEHESNFTQCNNILRTEKSDSGIDEDTNLHEGNSSSNANQSDTDAVNTRADSSDPMDVDLCDITPNESFVNTYNSDLPSTSRKEGLVGHYIDGDAFVKYYKEKIHQLPLPSKLQLYVNHNRQM